MSYIFEAGLHRILICFAIAALLITPFIISHVLKSKEDDVTEQVKEKQGKLVALVRRIRNGIMVLNSGSLALILVKGVQLEEDESFTMAVLLDIFMIVMCAVAILFVGKMAEVIVKNGVVVYSNPNIGMTYSPNSALGVRQTQHERFTQYVEDRNSGKIVEPRKPQLNRPAQTTRPQVQQGRINTTASRIQQRPATAASEVARQPSPVNLSRAPSGGVVSRKPVVNNMQNERPVCPAAKKQPVKPSESKAQKQAFAAAGVAGESPVPVTVEEYAPFDTKPTAVAEAGGQDVNVGGVELGTFDLSGNSFEVDTFDLNENSDYSRYVSSDWDQ